MKKLLFLTPLTLLFACGPKAPANQWTLNATIEDTPSMVLLNYTLGEENRVDTARLADGLWTLSGTIDEPTNAMLGVMFETREGEQPRVSHTALVLEPGVITIAVPQNQGEATVAGTVTNDEVRRWNDTIRPLHTEIQQLDAWYRGLTDEERKAAEEETKAKFRQIQGNMKAMAREYVAANPDSWFALGSLFRQTFDGQDADAAQKVLDGFTERVRSTSLGKKTQEMIDGWRRIAIGASAPDFSQPDADGNQMKLSDLRGKWVLVDFWASWCGPCRQENPNVVAAYNAFKEKGFTILGVSLDSNRDAWIKAIADDKLDWAHVGDMKGWGNEAAALYSVKSIPANFLINPEGEIVAHALRGEALHAKLAEVLGQ